MDDTKTIRNLARAVVAAARSARFCVQGALPNVSPGLEVAGIGPVRLPLTPRIAKRLIGVCKVAPYGKGTKTLVDTKVRNSFELGLKQFTLSNPQWQETIANATQQAAEQLGLPADRLEPSRYKLLVYQKGGFFLPHRDSEKLPGMVASLVVALPTEFSGGVLTVRHRDARQIVQFTDAAAGRAPCFAAFYADCEHEVSKVTHGYRVCLTYNLVLRPARGRSKAAATDDAVPTDDALVQAIRTWTGTSGSTPLVFALDHHYTERGLSLDLLKGNDRQAAGIICRAAEQAGCRVYLAQVTRHLQQFADDGSCGKRYSRYRGAAPRRLEIGETYEDELKGTQWTDLKGKKQPFGEIPLDLASIVASVPIDQWTPTREDYEGYTGNEGNTLDRWYHRSAVFVWAESRHFDIVARMGTRPSLELLKPMVAKLKKTPQKRLDQARKECARFTTAIVANWRALHRGYGHIRTRRERGIEDEFPEMVLAIGDAALMAAFLSRVAPIDPGLDLRKFVVAACRQHGWATFQKELENLVRGAEPASLLGHLPWLGAVCCSREGDPNWGPLAKRLCQAATGSFCQPPMPARGYFPGKEPTLAKSVESLVKALIAVGDVEELARVLQYVQTDPTRFSIADLQVPCLEAVVPWARKRFGDVPPLVLQWIADVRGQLETATAAKPAPPRIWARPVDVSCNCQFCRQLNAFLSDPDREVERIPARQDARQHLISQIRRFQLDVTATLERKGSPYSLVCKKTNGSFERALTSYRANLKLLERIRALTSRQSPRTLA